MIFPFPPPIKLAHDQNNDKRKVISPMSPNVGQKSIYVYSNIYL